MTFELEGEYTNGKVMGLAEDDVEDNVVAFLQSVRDTRLVDEEEDK